jgi:hypothetical protein
MFPRTPTLIYIIGCEGGVGGNIEKTYKYVFYILPPTPPSHPIIFFHYVSFHPHPDMKVGVGGNIEKTYKYVGWGGNIKKTYKYLFSIFLPSPTLYIFSLPTPTLYCFLYISPHLTLLYVFSIFLPTPTLYMFSLYFSQPHPFICFLYISLHPHPHMRVGYEGGGGGKYRENI